MPIPSSILAVRFLLGMVALSVGPLVVWEALRAWGFVPAAPTLAENVEGSCVALLVSALFVAVLAWRLPTAMPLRPVQVVAAVRVYATWLLPWVLLLVGYLWVVSIVPQRQLDYVVAAEFARPGYWLVVLVITLAAPFAEEVVFRGYLLGALLQPMGNRAAIVTSAAVFGLGHGVEYALPTGVLGIIFGWLAVHRGLSAAMLAHALHNSITVAVHVLWPDTLDWLYRR